MPAFNQATVNDSRERRFHVSDGHRTYEVQATQTHRAHPHCAEAKLEWQFYIEALDLILVQDGSRYVSIDDPNRVFRTLGSDALSGVADAVRAREAI